MKKIICLMGPTATGKSDLAIRAAETLPYEIISVDSVMVYRDLNIGSAKPSQEILDKTKHHLIDVAEPQAVYSAGQFYRDAWQAIDSIIARGKTPLLVGGTMLYFKLLFSGVAPLPEADHALREQIYAEALQQGWPRLHARLKLIDPAAAEQIKPNDSQRIQRALEVYFLTGQALSEWHQQTPTAHVDAKFIKLALNVDRPTICMRIVERFEQMLKAGFLDEVQALYQRSNLHAGLPAIRAVGYRQAWQYLADQLSFTEMKENAVIATRQLAKRQMTWLRSFEDVTWVNANVLDLAGYLD